MNVLVDARLPNIEYWFQAPFKITQYHNEAQLRAALPEHTILICRSTLKVNEKLLRNTPIRCVATASSGVDHVDQPYLAKQGISFFHAKGSNAHAVADYVTACIAYLMKNTLLHGKKAGIIGLGEVGLRVAARLLAIGYTVYYFDPYKPDIYQPSLYPSHHFATLYDCDLLCIHADLHNNYPFSTVHLLDKKVLSNLKHNSVIINAARGGIVDEIALLKQQKSIVYCTDVYEHEPNIRPAIIDYAALCTPHIAGHSIEAKHNAVQQISNAIHKYYSLELRSAFSISTPFISGKKKWSEEILTVYDPSKETTELKEAVDKTKTFLALREAHRHRHDILCSTEQIN